MAGWGRVCGFGRRERESVFFFLNLFLIFKFFGCDDGWCADLRNGEADDAVDGEVEHDD